MAGKLPDKCKQRAAVVRPVKLVSIGDHVMAKSGNVAPVSDDKAAEYEARAKADFNPTETARERFERLQTEMADKLKALRDAESAAIKEDRDSVLDGIEEKIVSLLKGIESNAGGRKFRAFTFMYANPHPVTWESNVKIKSRLVKPRQRD